MENLGKKEGTISPILQTFEGTCEARNQNANSYSQLISDYNSIFRVILDAFEAFHFDEIISLVSKALPDFWTENPKLHYFMIKFHFFELLKRDLYPEAMQLYVVFIIPYLSSSGLEEVSRKHSIFIYLSNNKDILRSPEYQISSKLFFELFFNKFKQELEKKLPSNNEVKQVNNYFLKQLEIDAQIFNVPDVEDYLVNMISSFNSSRAFSLMMGKIIEEKEPNTKTDFSFSKHSTPFSAMNTSQKYWTESIKLNTHKDYAKNRGNEITPCKNFPSSVMNNPIKVCKKSPIKLIENLNVNNKFLIVKMKRKSNGEPAPSKKTASKSMRSLTFMNDLGTCDGFVPTESTSPNFSNNTETENNITFLPLSKQASVGENERDIKHLKSKSISSFKFECFKREDVNKNILRRFKKFVKKFFSNKPDSTVISTNNYPILKHFIKLNILPPMSFKIGENIIEFKSFNSSFIFWLFSHPGIKELFAIFIKQNLEDFLTEMERKLSMNVNIEEKVRSDIDKIRLYLIDFCDLYNVNSNPSSLYKKLAGSFYKNKVTKCVPISFSSCPFKVDSVVDSNDKHQSKGNLDESTIVSDHHTKSDKLDRGISESFETIFAKNLEQSKEKNNEYFKKLNFNYHCEKELTKNSDNYDTSSAKSPSKEFSILRPIPKPLTYDYSFIKKAESERMRDHEADDLPSEISSAGDKTKMTI